MEAFRRGRDGSIIITIIISSSNRCGYSSLRCMATGLRLQGLALCFVLLRETWNIDGRAPIRSRVLFPCAFPRAVFCGGRTSLFSPCV